MINLDGFSILVTGAAQGIGATMARGFAERGARVALADIADPTGAAESIIEAGGDAVAIKADVSVEDACHRMVAKTVEAFGSLDGLVCNAALFATLPATPFDEISIEDWDRVMAVNVRGPWLCARAAKDRMAQAGGGSIVMMASNRIFSGSSLLLHYDASKGAVQAMAKSLAREVGPLNIRINTIAPGLTMSEGVQARPGVEDRNAAIVRERALGRTQIPNDIVGAAAFLLCHDSASITGQTVVIDGGGIMH